MPFRHFIIKTIVLILLFPVLASAQQLRDFDITPVQSTRLPVFTQHPDKAAVIINSSLTNLQFDSNLEIIAILGNPSQGEYILIINPVRQTITVSANGFQQGRVPITLNQARQVAHFKVEPKDRIITETATLIVRTDPSGATVSIDGIPGEYTTPHTFPSILAITHTLRIRLDDYQSEERLVRLEAGRANVEAVTLTPLVGYLLIREPDLELFLKTADDPQEFRMSYAPNQPVRYLPGTYTYRAQKQFYRSFTDTVTVVRGLTTELALRFEPNFSTLRVRANAQTLSLSSPDNRAPLSNTPNAIFLEQGQREVLVEAPGFAPVRILVRSVAGAVTDTTLTLISQEQANEQARREALPRGVLQLAADVEADIYVNGTREGRLQAVLTLVPGRYDVEFRHPLKSKRFSVDVPSADVVVRQVSLRPQKSTAMFVSMVLPGSGHLYTKQRRGFVYFAAVASGVAFSVMQNDAKNRKISEHQAAFSQYLASTTVADASLYKIRAESARLDANKATDLLTYGLAATAGVYLIQLADIQFTRPRYGYRSKSPAFEVGLAPTGFQLTYRLP